MNEFEAWVRTLIQLARDPETDPKVRAAADAELHDIAGPDAGRELAQLEAFDALEKLKELARSAKDPEVRRDAKQAVEQYELAREAYIRKVTGNED